MTISVEIEYPNLEKMPTSFFNGYFSGNIVLKVGDVNLTKRKQSDSDSSCGGYLIPTLSNWLEEIPNIMKDNTVICDVIPEPCRFIFKPDIDKNEIGIKFQVVDGYEENSKITQSFEGKGNFFQANINDFIEQLIKVSKEVSLLLPKYNPSVEQEVWYLKFNHLIKEAEKIYSHND